MIINHPRIGYRVRILYYPHEKEYVQLRCCVHTGKLESTAAKLWLYVGGFPKRIHCDLANGLLLNPYIWDDLLDGMMTMHGSEEEMASGTLFELVPVRSWKRRCWSLHRSGAIDSICR